MSLPQDRRRKPADSLLRVFRRLLEALSKRSAPQLLPPFRLRR
nr:MAG TPA: hypothetical protein [Caudoviricetes sp.]